MRVSFAILLFALLPAAAPAAPAAATGDRSLAVLSPAVGGRHLQWSAPGDADDFGGFVLTVSAPGGEVLRREFAAGAVPEFDLSSLAVVRDGAYVWELRAASNPAPEVRSGILATHGTEGDSESGRAAAAAPATPATPATPAIPAIDARVWSGSFGVLRGVLVDPRAVETRRPRPALSSSSARDLSASSAVLVPIAAADQVVPDDLIVQGSECVGLDCVNNESFGFDTLRLKENNLRIHFDDTSGTGFPANDWRLIANDSASGGASKFSIEDSTAGRTPFTITAGARDNAVFVDSSGRVGFGTATPVLNLHVNSSDTPALRLEQNNSGGFTAQTWDVAGNEANFFVRDVTGGSRLSFRIRPGAPTSSIDISANGDVGVGTASPSKSLHVQRSDGTAGLKVSETSGTVASRVLLTLENNGGVNFNLKDNSLSATWGTNLVAGNYRVTKAGSGVSFASELQGNGNLTIAGTLTQNSDRDTKREIEAVDPAEVLATLDRLPIATWNRKSDDPAVRHMGPMAQDFAALFRLNGKDDRHLSALDLVGVSLASIQALHRQVNERQEQIAVLEKKNAEMEARLAQLEAAVAALAAK